MENGNSKLMATMYMRQDIFTLCLIMRFTSLKLGIFCT